MPDRNSIDVVVYPAQAILTETDDYLTELRFNDVQFISFVSSPGGAGEGTYGIPALLKNEAKAEGLPCGILYVNPANIAAMLVTRKA